MDKYFVEEAASYMRYHDFPGEDTPILFIHGLGCASTFDYPQVAAQKELNGHRRILVDLLGAGYSDKPLNFIYSVSAHAAYLKSFLDSLDLKSFILFGHSLGGPVVIELAKMCADKVQCLILSEPNLDPSEEGAYSYMIAQFPEKYFIEKGFREIIAESKNNGSTMWAASMEIWTPAAAYHLSQSAVQGGTPSWRKTLYELPVSKGFILGEKSLPYEDYTEMKRHGIHVEVVDRAGHSMAWENPEGLALAISRRLEL
ncbi:MAG: alpha/beta fold hydrolase [Lachnospiraceae bacterium]